MVGHINSQLNLAELLRMMAQMPMVSKVDLRQLKPVNAGNPELIFEIIAWIKPSIGTTE
ncbi:MAG: hypothetical protein HWD59_01855 [Coxiellaceae bacterium]|nr:MAG: hypothetical protein HWD59_01855 [Coxiellaceae bacterium]